MESNDTIVSRLAEQDKVLWYNKLNLRRLYILIALCCFGAEMTFGYELALAGGLQSVSTWFEYFHHPRSALLGLMVAVYPLGFAVAVPFIPWAVDHMGRRFPIWLGGVIIMISCIMQAAAFNVGMFIIARFVRGFANTFCIVAASSLIGELTHPNERAFMGSLFGNALYIGAVPAAGLIFWTHTMTSDWGWRIPCFAQAIPSLLQVSFVWFLPESPRWLISRGRGDEARAILVKYHAEGDKNAEFVKAEYAQIENTVEAEHKVANMTWKEAFTMPGMQKRATIAMFLGLAAQWCGIGLTENFLPPVLDTIGIHDNHTKNIINLAKFFWGFINSTALCTLVLPRYSRRTMYLTCTISIFIVFTALTMASAEYSLTGSQVSAQIVLILIFLFNPAYNIGFTMVHAYLVELFPFHVRARGLSVYQLCGCLGAFINQFVDPIGISAVGWRWFIVYCMWNAFQIVFVYIMFPETSGHTLEELRFLYESDQEHDEVEALSGHGAAQTSYGSVQGNAGC